MKFLSLIEAKRDGKNLSGDDIKSLVGEFTAGRIPDYQMAALLMAIHFRGLSAGETRAFTLAMRDSGEVLKFPDDPRPIVDKHSTGGVGDKVSLPLAPLLACLGFRVPMISGRGLGITGGTLDKLESIPGFTTALPPERIVEQVQSIGVAIVGQTANMVPADKALYSLRDVTGTVPSIPLITASILSKKLAESLHALVMDVKCGTAAFMQTREQARELAQSIVSLAGDCGVKTRALLTDMNTPIGRAAGNWLEVKEAIDCLEGRGPADLNELVIDCAAHLLLQTQPSPGAPVSDPAQINSLPGTPSSRSARIHPFTKASAFDPAPTPRPTDLTTARKLASDCLASGQPRRKWDELLAAQGADLAAFNRKLRHDCGVPSTLVVCASKAQFVTHCDARVIGEVVRDLGGGRLTKDTIINPDVGIDCLVKPGERVEPGTPLFRIHAATDASEHQAATRLLAAIQLSDEPPPPARLIHEVI